MTIERIRTSAIRTDGGTQMRAAIDRTVVADYAEAYTNSANMPPVVVFYDGSSYWVADGFHRVEAQRTLSFAEIDADVRAGSQRDAKLYAVGANITNGLRRSNADKRRAVETMLLDEEWSRWSDRKIAEQCGVGHPLIARVRTELSGTNSRCDELRPRTVERGGVVYQQNTAAIGRRARPEQTAALVPTTNLFVQATDDTSAERDEESDDESVCDNDLSDDDGDVEIIEDESEPRQIRRESPVERWTPVEGSQLVSRVLAVLRDCEREVDECFAASDPAFLSELRRRTEDALLRTFESLAKHLPATSARVAEARAHFHVIKGGQ